MTIRYRETFNRASKSIPYSICSVLEKRGFTNLEVIFKWKDIVGPEIAAILIPHSVRYKPITRPRYSLETDKTFILVLTLSVLDKSLYYKFDYIKSDVLKQINLYFGRKMFDELACIKEDVEGK